MGSLGREVCKDRSGRLFSQTLSTLVSCAWGPSNCTLKCFCSIHKGGGALLGLKPPVSLLAGIWGQVP